MVEAREIRGQLPSLATKQLFEARMSYMRSCLKKKTKKDWRKDGRKGKERGRKKRKKEPGLWTSKASVIWAQRPTFRHRAPMERQGVVASVCSQCWCKDRNRWLRRTHLLANPAKSMSSKFIERPCLRYKVEGWENGSVSKGLMIQVWRPKFKCPDPT